MKYSKMVVVFIILLNISFTLAILYAFLRIGNEPTTLIVSWFAFTTGELWMLSGIKKTKIKSEVKNESYKLETEIDEP